MLILIANGVQVAADIEIAEVLLVLLGLSVFMDLLRSSATHVVLQVTNLTTVPKLIRLPLLLEVSTVLTVADKDTRLLTARRRQEIIADPIQIRTYYYL